MSINELVERFRLNAIEQGIHIEKSDGKGNIAYNKKYNAYKKLVILNKDNELIKLLDDENKWVQLSAAIFTLESNEKESIKVLKKLKWTLHFDIPSSARIAIKEWKLGNLKYRSKVLEEIENEKNKIPKRKDKPVDFEKQIENIQEILNNYNLLKTKENNNSIEENNQLENRFSLIESYVGSILGNDVDFVEFCPDNDPPNKNEVLAWLWLIHPEWYKGILNFADNNLKEAIEIYEEEKAADLK